MKKLVFYTALALGVPFTSHALLSGQDPSPRERLQQRQINPVDKVDRKTTGGTMRVSELNGMDIHNMQGEEIGEVEDLVIDATSGKVRYAAVSYGGILGIGDKMFAVPFEAFKFLPEKDDRDNTLLVLNVSKQQLEGAQGFDQDHWPNFADKSFTDELDRRYKVDRKQRGGTDVDVTIDSERDR